jgi:hypothetical protein
MNEKLILFLLIFGSLSCGKKEAEPSKSSEKKIISFKVTIENKKYSADIDSIRNSITLTVPFGTPLNQIIPEIELSPKSTISPSENTILDFSKTLIFKVLAEDGSSINYNFNAIIETQKNTEKFIKTAKLIIENQEFNATIDSLKKAINFLVPMRTNIKSLSPIIEISNKSSLIPVSGSSHDFTSPITYTITAEDGSKSEYTFSIKIYKPVGQFSSLCQITNPKNDISWYNNRIIKLKQNYINTDYKYLHSYYGFLSKNDAGNLDNNRPTLFDKNDPKDILIFRLSNSANEVQEIGESIWFYECNGTFITEGYDGYFPAIQNLKERYTFDVVKLK